MNHDYLASQFIAGRQAAALTRAAQAGQVRAARKARAGAAATASRPARTRWLVFARLAPARA